MRSHSVNMIQEEEKEAPFSSFPALLSVSKVCVPGQCESSGATHSLAPLAETHWTHSEAKEVGVAVSS